MRILEEIMGDNEKKKKEREGQLKTLWKTEYRKRHVVMTILHSAMKNIHIVLVIPVVYFFYFSVKPVDKLQNSWDIYEYYQSQ